MPSVYSPSYRFSLWNLILKDFRTQYRNMSLGMLWSVLNPLIMLGTLLVVFTFIHKNESIEHFGVFLLLGLIPFNFFSLCLNTATNSMVQNGQILKKMRFPRMIIPIASVLSQVIHLGIQLGILLFFILISGVSITWMYLWLPVILILELAFIIGLALICSILDVYFRDTQYIVQSVTTVLFWFTPIFYPASQANQTLPRPLYLLFMANPLSGCIEAARRVVLHDSPPEWDLFKMAFFVALLALGVGICLFRKLEPNLADHL